MRSNRLFDANWSELKSKAKKQTNEVTEHAVEMKQLTWVNQKIAYRHIFNVHHLLKTANSNQAPKINTPHPKDAVSPRFED